MFVFSVLWFLVKLAFWASAFWVVLSIACCVWVNRSGSCKMVPPTPLHVLFYPFIVAAEYLPENVVERFLGVMNTVVEKIDEFRGNNKETSPDGK